MDLQPLPYLDYAFLNVTSERPPMHARSTGRLTKYGRGFRGAADTVWPWALGIELAP